MKLSAAIRFMILVSIEWRQIYEDGMSECFLGSQPKIWPTNCPKYANDDIIRYLFPFEVELNPEKPTSSKTYALTNKENNIYYLNIYNQKCFPSIIFCLKHLEQLYVRNTSFAVFNDQLPPMIEVFSSTLIKFEIYGSPISQLPKEIGKLKNLQYLKISNANLRYLPDSFGDLSSLNFLSVTDNKLTYLPETMKNLLSVEEIILTNNPNLRSIEPVNGLPLLRTLRTNNCSIEYIPRNLPRLQNLYMKNNRLTSLTGIETLGNGIQDRKTFDFNQNFIRSIPSEIQYVLNFNYFNLNNNQLKNLPYSMFNMNTLEKLLITNNNISNDDLKQIIKIFKCTNPKLILDT